MSQPYGSDLRLLRFLADPLACENSGASAQGEERIGKYRLLRQIGRGGVGVVYLAEDPELERRVALKVLRPERSDAGLVKRFQREATIAAKLRHPNIIAIYEVGTVPDGAGRETHYIAMECVEGKTLAEQMLLRPRTELLRILEEVARAVGVAHQLGVIHRDLKPSNVLMDPAGRPILTDFGLAHIDHESKRLTKSEDVIGTPAYMAPEQARGEAKGTDERTDVYALGVMMYEMLTGRLPFERRTAAELLAQIVTEEPKRPSTVRSGIPRDLEVICLKALEKEKRRRYSRAVELAEDLARYRRGEPIQARPPGLWLRGWKWACRRRLEVAAGIMVLAAAGTVAGIFVPRWLRERRMRAQDSELHRRREAELHELATLWSRIVMLKRDLRDLRVTPAKGRAQMSELVSRVGPYTESWPAQGAYIRAWGNMCLGDLEGAEAELRGVLARIPEFKPGWRLLGAVRCEISSCRAGTATDPKDATRMKMTVVREALEAWKRAGEEEDSARWGLPWTIEEHVLRNMTKALVMAHEEGRLQEAGEFLERCLEEYEAEEYIALLGDWVGPWEEQEAWYARAIRRAPGYGGAYLKRAEGRFRCGRFEQAIADYDEAIKLNPDSAAIYLNRGGAKWRKGDLVGALADCNEAIRLHPTFPESYCNRGLVKEDLGDTDGAMADYDQAIRLRPENPVAYTHRGALLLNKKADFEAAQRDFDRAIELRSVDPVDYRNRGIAKQRRGDLPGAISDYDHALRIDPAYAEAFNSRGLAKQEQGHHAAAVLDFDEAIRQKPDYFNPYFNRGASKATTGDLEGAVADMERAIGLAPPSPVRTEMETSLRQVREALEKRKP